MPTTLTATPSTALPIEPPRKRWTRDQCQQLERVGLLDQQRLELVDGDLINKMGKNRPHVVVLAYMMHWLFQTFGKETVNSECPADVALEDNPSNEPQPDLVVFKQPSNLVASRNPRPDELHLVIEVSDTSLYFDLTKKAALYARAGIVEYWVLDVAGRKLFVHRDPRAGKFQSITEYTEQESVAPLAAPAAQFLVSSAFPSSELTPG